MGRWKPKEIIVNEKVRNDPITAYFIQQCSDIPIKYIDTGVAKHIVIKSQILSSAGDSMLDKILAGKQVVYIAPATKKERKKKERKGQVIYT